jgi:hypothetical protein
MTLELLGQDILWFIEGAAKFAAPVGLMLLAYFINAE